MEPINVLFPRSNGKHLIGTKVHSMSIEIEFVHGIFNLTIK